MADRSTMSKRYIAFLRAINVGGHTVTMETLRREFAALGHANVATFIASGNVIFDSLNDDTHELEMAIATHLKQALGYAVATFIRTPAEVAAVAQAAPFGPPALVQASTNLNVAFLWTTPPDNALAKLLPYRTATDDFAIDGREVFWLRQGRISDSTFSGALLERALGLPATMRNITTVRTLAARYSEM